MFMMDQCAVLICRCPNCWSIATQKIHFPFESTACISAVETIMSSFNLIVLLVTALFAIGSSQSYTDMFCAEFDEINDTNGCPHGARNNSCSKLACLRGLGEPCDVLGMPILHGDCADGLFCACGQCVGCIKGRCGQDDCLLQRRHWKGSNTISYKLPVQQLESVRYRKRMMKMPLLRFGYDYANGEE